MTFTVRKQATITSAVQTTPTSATISASVACDRSATAAVSSAPDPPPSTATTHGATARGRARAETTGTGAVARLLPTSFVGLSVLREGGMTYRRGKAAVATPRPA